MKKSEIRIIKNNRYTIEANRMASASLNRTKIIANDIIEFNIYLNSNPKNKGIVSILGKGI
jgi:predicted transcriptional regulator